MSDPVKHWTSAQVKALLRARFGGGSQSMVMFEVRNSTGHDANRSIDAVTMSLWPSLGLELTGMEIKISRSDWLRELKDPAKASATFEYFDRWYLVAPRNVAKIEEIPGPWGWMAPENDKLVVIKKAPENPDIKPIDRKFLAALLRGQAAQDDGLIEAAVSRAVEVERKRLNENHKESVEREVASRTRQNDDAAKSWRELVAKLGERSSYLAIDDLVAAVGVVHRLGVRGSYGAITSLQNTLARSSQQIADALSQFDEIQAAANSEENAA